jgi:hypothetical protein
MESAPPAFDAAHGRVMSEAIEMDVGLAGRLGRYPSAQLGVQRGSRASFHQRRLMKDRGSPETASSGVSSAWPTAIHSLSAPSARIMKSRLARPVKDVLKQKAMDPAKEREVE